MEQMYSGNCEIGLLSVFIFYEKVELSVTNAEIQR